MAIYLKIDGIPGDATHKGHEKWINVDSLQWGAGRAVSTPVGSAGKREASEPSISEVTMTKSMDTASVKLFQEAVTGAAKDYKIDFISTGDPGDLYLQIELTNALISGYSISSGGDRPSESINVNFTKVQFKYVDFDQHHKPGTPVIGGYDLATAKKS